MRVDAPGRRGEPTRAPEGDGSREAGRGSDRVGDRAREAIAADPEAEAHYWQARAIELERQLDEVRERMLVLARRLPVGLASRVDGSSTEIWEEALAEGMLEGWVETTALRPSAVAAEMQRVWSRLRLERDG